MRKCYLFTLALVSMLAVSGHAQFDLRRSLFFSVGAYSNTFFDNDHLYILPNFWLRNYTIAIASVNLEFPLWIGNAALGLRGGYSSGSNFGGQSGKDLIPINLTGAYTFPIIENILSVGPGIKIGAMALIGSEWNEMIFHTGGWLEAEIQYPYIPVSLYVAAGIDVFPTTHEAGMFPILEAGIRFPRRTRPWPSRQPVAPITDLSQGDGREQAQLSSQDPQDSQEQETDPAGFADFHGLINPVFFEPDSSILIESSRPNLEAVGQQLAADPSLKILLRAYTAPFGTVGGRQMVSDGRANFCRNYLIQHYGIAPDRINSELYGSERAPDHVTSSSEWTYYRCVELIVY